MSFGGIGFVTFAAAQRKYGYASAVRIQADGRIVAGGSANKRMFRDEDFALVRLESRAGAATRFGSFTARVSGGRVVVRWRTESELGTRRFLFYRLQAGREKLIGRFPARGSGSRGATYSTMDHPSRRAECCPGYSLVEVKRNGRQIRYGPVVP